MKFQIRLYDILVYTDIFPILVGYVASVASLYKPIYLKESKSGFFGWGMNVFGKTVDDA